MLAHENEFPDRWAAAEGISATLFFKRPRARPERRTPNDRRLIEADLRVGEVPELVSSRTMSVRAYDKNGMMIDGSVVSGAEIKDHIEKLFADPRIEYLHLHSAGAGCYSCKVERAALR